MNNTVENNDFLISQGTVATSDRRGGQSVRFFMSNFLRISLAKNHQNRLIFDRVIQKIKGGRFWDTV